jgi:hypothetical protein
MMRRERKKTEMMMGDLHQASDDNPVITALIGCLFGASV